MYGTIPVVDCTKRENILKNADSVITQYSGHSVHFYREILYYLGVTVCLVISDDYEVCHSHLKYCDRCIRSTDTKTKLISFLPWLFFFFFSHNFETTILLRLFKNYAWKPKTSKILQTDHCKLRAFDFQANWTALRFQSLHASHRISIYSPFCNQVQSDFGTVQLCESIYLQWHNIKERKTEPFFVALSQWICIVHVSVITLTLEIRHSLLDVYFINKTISSNRLYQDRLDRVTILLDLGDTI